ncbi:MAG: MBL fold metallo-hydrolase [Clostridia bacterium]|nr:MBL fold metallo-hydrolase [Clostridia bacterium]
MKERPRIEPSKITDDLYWVGVNAAAPSHLLVTDDGLVLIDSGSTNTIDGLIENITSLGFDVHDVKHIIHSHAHYDHVGATNKIVAISGAKTYGSAQDADSYRGKNKILWCLHTPPENENEFYFEPDVLINDGDVLEIGGRRMRFLVTPGHTEGVLSMFYPVHYKGKEYIAGSFGGAGYNSLKEEYLDHFSLPYSLREDYIISTERLMRERVDVHIGNHPGNNRHGDKAARLTADYNPFVEENTWQSFLVAQRNGLIERYNLDFPIIEE